MADERGAPLLHVHKGCGQVMKPVLVCSECAEPVTARDIRVEPGAAWLETGLFDEAVGRGKD